MKYRLHIFASFFLLIFFFSAKLVLAQTKVAPDKYWVAFRDKLNSSYSIERPSEFLSPKAINRRIKYNIPVDEFDLPVNQNYIDSVKALGLQVYYASKWLNGILVYSKDANLVNEVKKFDFVVDFLKTKPQTENQIVEKKLEESTEPTYKFVEMKNSANNIYDYGYGLNQIEMLNGNKLHNEGFNGKGVLMAIMDAGFYKVNQLKAFDSLWTNKQILSSKDFVDMDSTSWDADSHGMKVLSTIASNLPGKFVGTAPKADFILIRTEDAGSENIIEEFNWVAGAEHADSLGADIIHSSLGYSNFDDTAMSHTYADMNGDFAPSTIGADIAAQKGILVVVSAGNEGNDAWKYITAPADADSVLTVGATDRYGYYAYFSSMGPTPDGRIKPNVAAQGLNSTVISTTGEVSTSSGTSFSGPIIAGMAASLWQARPELSNMELISAMQNNASQATKPDSLLGYGIPDFYMAYLYPTKIENLEQNREILVFPNPSTGNFEIKFSKVPIQKTVQIDVINLNGRVLETRNLTIDNDNKLDFSGLNNVPNGMYFLRIQAGEQAYKLKMLKQ
jgi:hypothetical protein